MKKIRVALIVLTIALIATPLFSNGQTEDTITVWIPGDEVEYGFYFDALASYQEKMQNEGKDFNYVVEQQPWSDYWVKLPLEVNNKRGPDLFLTHWAYDENLRGICKELKLSQSEKNMFYVSDLYLGTNGEPVYIPTTFVSKVMYVNRSLAPNFNVENALTWDGFVEELKKLVPGSNSKDALAEGIIPFQYAFQMLYDLRYSEGKTFTDENGKSKLDNTGFAFLKSLDDMKISSYIERSGAGDELNNATAAVVYGEPWMEFWASPEVKDSIEAFPVPGSYTTKALELSFGINKNVSDERFEVLNGFVKYMLMDKDVNTSIVKGSSGTPNLKNLTVEYRPESAGYANVNTKHALLLIPPVVYEDVISNMIEDWEGLGGTKTTEQVIKDANFAASSIDLSGLKAMEDEFRTSL